MKPIAIVGMGLAGVCTAWQLWRKGAAFRLIDSGRRGSSHIAAGLVHPVTGKNCTVAENYEIHYEEAQAFYQTCELVLQKQVWFPLETLRLVSLIEQKKLLPKFQSGAASKWVTGTIEDRRWSNDLVFVLKGGARLDVALFLQSSRDFFAKQGVVEEREFTEPLLGETTILCEGAQGLMGGRPIQWKHRCMKGEILTIHAPSWKESRLITGSGWLVPIGEDLYKVGATYDAEDLDEQPTAAGLAYLESVARKLGGEDYMIHSHDAGIRPILRKSLPIAGAVTPDLYVFNGLGSKGSLSSPWASRCLVTHLLDGALLQSSLSLANYFATLGHPS